MIVYNTFYDSPIGLIEIIGSKHAIHALRFVTVKTSSEKKFPQIINVCIEELDNYFSGNLKKFSVNTEQTGTDFQKLVWKTIEEVPFGATTSYIQVARKIGDEKSLRAVGNANGKNKIPIIVPCHRIIGADDSLTGYGGGLWRKQWLLDHEKKYTYGVQKLFNTIPDSL